MNTRNRCFIALTALLGFAQSASAHESGVAHGVSWLHYFSSPDHLAVLGLVSVLAVTCMTAFKARKARVSKD